MNATAKQTRKPQTCIRVNQGRWCQESYETASRDAGRRAKELRNLGYAVSVSAMGPQVTGLGVIKLTLVDIRPGANEDTCSLPHTTEMVEWPR